MISKKRGWRTVLACGVAVLSLHCSADDGAALDSEASADALVSSRSTSTAGFTNTKTLTIAAPAGTMPGDVLVASLGFGESSLTAQPTLTAPAGFTLVNRTSHGTVGTLAVYWHVFAAGETSYTFTTNELVFGSGWISAYVGVDTKNPIDVAAGRDVTAGGTSIATPSITTTGNGETLVASFVGTSNPAATWTAPSGMTERADVNNADARAGTGDDEVQATAGASGAKTATSSVALVYALAHVLALRPAAAPAPAPTNVNDYYVGKTGCSDAQARNASTPWCSIATADAKLVLGTGGTVVHVLPGTYAGPITTNRSGTASARIAFRSDTKWGAKITNANWLIQGSYVDVADFDLTSPGVNGYGFLTIAHQTTSAPLPASFVRITGNYLHDFQTSSCGFSGAIGTSQAGKTGWIPSTDIQIVGNVIRHIGDYALGTNSCVTNHGIYSSGLREIIENNVISGATGWGIKRDAPPGPGVISNNTVFSNGGGINMTECNDQGCGATWDYNTVSNNIIVANGVDGPSGGRFGIDYYHVTGTHNLVTNNLIYGNKPADYAHHDVACTGGTPISGSDANGTAGGCPSTNAKSDPGTSTTFAAFKSDGASAPAASYDVDDYRLRAGSSAIGGGTMTCAAGGKSPCVFPTSFDGTARATPPSIGAF